VILAAPGTLPEMDASTRILTVPNGITFVRICLIPVFAWLLATHRDLAAALLLGGIASTDFVDGKIARRFNQVSELGKALDPVADRLLLLTAVVGVIWRGDIVPLWLAVVVLAREVAVSAWVIYLTGRRAPRIDVRYVGKAGALCLMFSIPLFIGASGVSGALADAVRFVAYGFGVAGAVLAYVAFGYYLLDGRAALRSIGASRSSKSAAFTGDAKR
jgi:cardiolipin synthase